MESSFANILHEDNGNFKEAHLIQHREIKITLTEECRFFDFVMLVNKNITSLRVEHPVF